MPFTTATHHDPENLAILGQAYASAVQALQASAHQPTPADKSKLARRILEAADSGERDVDKLTFHALAAFAVVTRKGS